MLLSGTSATASPHVIDDIRIEFNIDRCYVNNNMAQQMLDMEDWHCVHQSIDKDNIMQQLLLTIHKKNEG